MESVARQSLAVWLEAVLLSGRLAWRDGSLVETLVPFELTRPLRIGPRGQFDLEWDHPGELIITPWADGVSFAWEFQRHVSKTVPAGGLFVGTTGPVFRVLSARRESAGWASALQVPTAPWDSGTLEVLGDRLLEEGFAVGARFHRRHEADDASWVPVLSRLAERGAQVTWQRGVVDSLVVGPQESWAFGVSLARHAVCKPMRSLTLQLAYADDAKIERIVGGLISAGGLPCLTKLHAVLDAKPEVLRQLKRTLEALPNLKAAFPALTELESRA